MIGASRGLGAIPRRVRRAIGGAAAIEFALSLSFLTASLLNVVDLGLYAYQRMQVENAAQSGAQAAWSACNTAAKLPATNSTNCPGFANAVTAGVQSTTLGSNVTQATGSPAEGYYCGTTSGALQLVGTAGTVGSPPSGAPATCAGVIGAADPIAPPGDYVQVSVTYPFTPLFGAISLAGLLTTPITKTTWTRMN
ncbi:MAG: TadE/TadG family type IV pilus assembly protein [Caulobacteraceae bacterium]